MIRLKSCSVNVRLLLLLLLVCCLCCFGQLVLAHNKASSQPQNCSQQPADQGTHSPPAVFSHQSAWHYNYFEEQTRHFDVLVRERSLDERLANLVYTLSTNRIIDMDFHTFDSGDARQDLEDMKLTAGNQVDDQTCGLHLEAMLAILEDLEGKLEKERTLRTNSESIGFEERHIRLARVMDSFGRFSAGQLLGRTLNFGSIEECVGTELLLPNVEVAAGREAAQRVPMRSCWARLKIDRHLNGELRTRKLEEYVMKKQLISTGICIPESCHTRSFMLDGPQHRERFQLIQKLVNTQFRLPKQLYLEENLELDSVYCHPDKSSSLSGLSFSGKLFVVLAGLYSILLVYSTYATNTTAGNDNSRPWSVFNSFDLNGSFREFLGDSAAKRQIAFNKVNLDTLNWIKVLGCAFVISGHSRLVLLGTASDGIKAYHTAQNDPITLMSILATMVVDTFFVITGIYSTFLTLNANAQRRDRGDKKIEPATTTTAPAKGKGEPRGSCAAVGFLKSWAIMVATRYARIVPVLFLVFWFNKSVLAYFLSDLPFWDDGFNRQTEFGACRRESWWSPMLGEQATLPIGQQCLPQAWSAVNDLFFALTVTPIILLLQRRPKLAIAMAVVLSAGGTLMAQRALDSIEPQMTIRIFDAKIHGFTLMFGAMSHIYTYPHFRFCSILAGVLAGYALFKYERNEIKQWPGWFSGPATKAALALLVVAFVVISQLQVLKGLLPQPVFRSITGSLIGTGRFGWSIFNAVLFLRMTSDWKDNYLMRMGAGKFWKVLVRLNYVLLVIHLDYIFFELSSKAPVEYSSARIYSLFASTYLFCLAVGMLVHVCFENPINKFVRDHVLAWLA